MKILFTYASAGAGHMKAAEALYDCSQNYFQEKTVLVDILDFASPVIKRMYPGTYFLLISKFPWLWSISFQILDLAFLQPFIRLVRRFYNHINAYRFEQYLKKEQFDYIFSTQFFCTEVASALKRQGSIHSQVITVITDFDVHRIWLAKGTDLYCVASDWTKEKLKKIGVLEDKIFVSGIPVHQQFSQVFDRVCLKRQLGLQENCFTVLLATGSFGIGPIAEIVDMLQNLPQGGVQIIVVCGRNQRLYQELTMRQHPSVKVFGHVNNMHELMAISDCMVTKPGGLSISEALVCQLPLIFFNPIPGQEVNNIKVLATQGIGFWAKQTRQILEEVKRLSHDRDVYMTMVKRVQILAKPKAAEDILALMREKR